MDGMDDDFLTLPTLKKVRNMVIGNLKQKRNFVGNGVLLRVTDAWEKVQSDSYLLCELIIIMGSLAQGVPEAVDQLVEYGGLNLLIKGLCHNDKRVIISCLKSLRLIYSTGPVPPNVLFQDINVVRQILELLNSPPPINESAAIIIGISCQCEDHQNILIDNNVLPVIQSLLMSQSPKVLCAALKCLCAIVKDNNKAVLNLLHDSISDTEGVFVLLGNLLSYSPSVHVKLHSAICLAHILKGSTSTSVIENLILGLVLLCKPDIEDLTVKIASANTLAFLISDDVYLQETASSTDNLISSLVTYLSDKPDDGQNELSDDDQSLLIYHSLHQSALRLLSELCSSVEDIRLKVITQPKMIQCLTQCIQSDVPATKIEATKCLLSLSRSTKLLRTYLSDVEIHMSKHVLEMLSSTNDEFVVVATSLACNLLLSFSPCREVLINEGVITILSNLSTNSNPSIQLNSIWALMNCARDTSEDVLNDIISGLPLEHLILIMEQYQNNEQLLLKCLGLLVNLTSSSRVSDSLMKEQDVPLVQALGALLSLSLGVSNEICEQILCVLLNVASGDERNRNIVAETGLVVECIGQILRTSTFDPVLMAACTLVQFLTDTSYGGNVHRQNCLEEVGIIHALRKLELTGSGTIQDLTRSVLDSCQTANL